MYIIYLVLSNKDIIHFAALDNVVKNKFLKKYMKI